MKLYISLHFDINLCYLDFDAYRPKDDAVILFCFSTGSAKVIFQHFLHGIEFNIQNTHPLKLS